MIVTPNAMHFRMGGLILGACRVPSWRPRDEQTRARAGLITIEDIAPARNQSSRSTATGADCERRIVLMPQL
jgi:hypothetical protein